MPSGRSPFVDIADDLDERALNQHRPGKAEREREKAEQQPRRESSRLVGSKIE